MKHVSRFFFFKTPLFPCGRIFLEFYWHWCVFHIPYRGHPFQRLPLRYYICLLAGHSEFSDRIVTHSFKLKNTIIDVFIEIFSCYDNNYFEKSRIKVQREVFLTFTKWTPLAPPCVLLDFVFVGRGLGCSERGLVVRESARPGRCPQVGTSCGAGP